MSGMSQHRWLLPQEAADMLRVSRQTLGDLIRHGALIEGVHFTRPVGLGRRFRLEALESYLAGTDQAERAAAAALFSDQPRRGRQGGKVNLRVVA